MFPHQSKQNQHGFDLRHSCFNQTFASYEQQKKREDRVLHFLTKTKKQWMQADIYLGPEGIRISYDSTMAARLQNSQISQCCDVLAQFYTSYSHWSRNWNPIYSCLCVFANYWTREYLSFLFLWLRKYVFYTVGTQVQWEKLWMSCPFVLRYSKALVIQWNCIIQLHPSADWNWLRDSQFLDKCINPCVK